MNLFDKSGAQHYCTALTAAPAGAVGSLRHYHDAYPKAKAFEEARTPMWEERRTVALHDIERNLFLAASNYVRALDLLTRSGAAWAHVTLYYASFFGANALVGMFGGWIDAPKRIVEVQARSPGNQELILKKKVVSPHDYSGSHRIFWDIFYESCKTIVHWAPGPHQFALQPVLGDPTWLISRRNDVNYDVSIAYRAIQQFPSTLNTTDFRRSLSGDMATQLLVTESLLIVVFEFAREFHLDSYGLSHLGVGKRKDCLKRLIADARLPKLVQQSKIGALAR